MYEFLILIVGMDLVLLGEKIWGAIGTYLDKKGENYATKQDIAEIETKTETVQAEFHKINEKFDADLKFKYQFYEEQYKKLYTGLFEKVCKSEALRCVLKETSKEKLQYDFNETPIVRFESTEGKNEIEHEILDEIHKNYMYASPDLLKWMSVIEEIDKCSDYRNADIEKIRHYALIKLVEAIMYDYEALRGKLCLSDKNAECETLENRIKMGEFIKIKV